MPPAAGGNDSPRTPSKGEKGKAVFGHERQKARFLAGSWRRVDAVPEG